MPAPEAAATVSDDLYKELAEITPKNLKRGVREVEKLSPEDVEALDRGGQHWMRTTTRQVKIAFMWVGFVFAVVVGIGALILLGCLMWSFGRDATEANKAGPVIAGILQFLAGVAVTLAVERFAKKS